MPIRVPEREYRDFASIAAAAEDQMIVTGYATVFDTPYVLYEDEELRILELVHHDAFRDADLSDVIMQYNHEGRVFARNRNNTLTVRPDGKGLYMEAALGGTDLGRGLYQEIRGGYTDKMSYGYAIGVVEWEEIREGSLLISTRTVRSIKKVYDVSAVSIPANSATSISVRSLADGVIAEVQAERLKATELALRRKRLELQTKILRGVK